MSKIQNFNESLTFDDSCLHNEGHNVEQRSNLKQRFLTSRIGRAAFSGVLSAGLVVGGAALESSPAAAESDNDLVYTVVNPDNDGANGIYDRNSPNWDDTDRSLPDISYNGDQLQLICGTNGEPVGPYNNERWHYARNVSRPEAGETWIPDRYLDTPNVANEPTPGERECDDSIQPPVSEEEITVIFYDRNAAVDWAREHSMDTPPYDASCTWFVSNALWQGGLPEDADWNDDGGHGRLNWRPGSVDAWEATHFKDYILETYPESSYTELDFASNSVPNAEVGDVIAYDWENDGQINHLSFITEIEAGQYPEVSEWSPLSDGEQPSPYVDRGWTWSEVSGQWLQEKTDYEVAAYLLHIDTDVVVEF